MAANINTDTHRAVAEMTQTIVQLVRMLPKDELIEIVQHGKHFDTIGPILDPTSWMHNHESNNRDTRVFAALLKFRAALDEVAEEVSR